MCVALAGRVFALAGGTEWAFSVWHSHSTSIVADTATPAYVPCRFPKLRGFLFWL